MPCAFASFSSRGQATRCHEPAHGRTRAVDQRLLRIGHDQLARERQHVAETAARRADAERAVEREQRGLGPDRRRAAVRALPALAAPLGLALPARRSSMAPSPRRNACSHDSASRSPSAALHFSDRPARALPSRGRCFGSGSSGTASSLCQMRVKPALSRSPGLLLPAPAPPRRDRREHAHALALGPARRLGASDARASRRAPIASHLCAVDGRRGGRTAAAGSRAARSRCRPSSARCGRAPPAGSRPPA